MMYDIARREAPSSVEGIERRQLLMELRQGSVPLLTGASHATHDHLVGSWL